MARSGRRLVQRLLNLYESIGAFTWCKVYLRLAQCLRLLGSCSDEMVGPGLPDARPLIAIVDDDASMLVAIGGLMRALGLRSKLFSSATEFLSSPDRAATACLITDVNMPGMGGLDLYLDLVTSGNSIPTIMITAYSNDGLRARALDAGVVCYLSKPFAEDELIACIRSALAGKS